jgi:phospholipase/carboxylesterase
MAYLPCVEIETSNSVNASVIWLHGLGGSGRDFETIVPELQLPEQAGVRFVFPNAPIISGMTKPAWYVIRRPRSPEMSIDRKIDYAEFLVSVGRINDLIQREIERGIASERIVLAGFSQGGAVAYHVALTSTRPLAGLLALSTYLVPQNKISDETWQLSLPVLVCHGLFDPVVPEMLSQKAIARLQAVGYQPEYKTYPMQHNMCAEEVSDIANWLHKCLIPLEKKHLTS